MAGPLAYSRPMNDQPQPLTPERIAVVVPALNEALRIRDVVQGALRHCPNVIVVDDGSDDGTADAIADLPVPADDAGNPWYAALAAPASFLQPHAIQVRALPVQSRELASIAP